jgi:hypothetical protein
MDAPARFRQTGAHSSHGFANVRFSILLSVFLLLGATSAALAGPGTYTGRAPVNSQSDDERAAALKTALANVIIEQSGDGGALARPDVASAVGKAERYVLQYTYRRNAGAEGAAMVLEAQFDAEAVDRMLSELRLGTYANAPVVPDTPTEVNVWIGGIRNADDYARVLGYLARSNFVREARPVQAQEDRLRVNLSLSTDLVHFLDAVGMERVLTVVGPATPDAADAVLALAQ